MSRWFRHYVGMMRDEKLVSIAVESKQPVERILWIWGAILESAAEINDGGRFEFDCAAAAYFLRTDLGDITAVVARLEAAERIRDGAVVKWGQRQFTSDLSAERQRRHRDNKKSASDGQNNETKESDGEVTVTSRHADGDVTPPDTERDTEAEIEKKDSPSLRSGGERPPKKSQATRIPEDWMPSLEDVAFAKTLLPDDRAAAEIPKFRDYWLARAGPNAVSPRWSARWRNWCRKATEIGHGTHRPTGSGAAQGGGFSARALASARRAAGAFGQDG